MSAYRETMGQVLQRMYDNKQLQIQERELSDTELKRREEIAKELPDEEFKDRYGSRWKEVKLATATKQAKSESVEEEKLERMDEAAGFSAGMISKLKKSYDGLKTINPTSPTAKKLFGVLDKMNKEQLIQIVKADINFLSLLAANRLIKDHNMSGAEINKLKESIRNEGYKPVKDNHYDVKVTLSDKEVKDVEKFIMNSPEYNKGDIEDVDMDQVMGGGMKFKGTGDIFIQGDDAGSLGVDLQKKFGRKIKVVGEETIHERSRQLKDPKKEMMISYKGSVMVINKKDWPKYEKKGAIQAEDWVEDFIYQVLDEVYECDTKEKFYDKFTPNASLAWLYFWDVKCWDEYYPPLLYLRKENQERMDNEWYLPDNLKNYRPLPQWFLEEIKDYDDEGRHKDD